MVALRHFEARHPVQGPGFFAYCGARLQWPNSARYFRRRLGDFSKFAECVSDQTSRLGSTRERRRTVGQLGGLALKLPSIAPPRNLHKLYAICVILIAFGEVSRKAGCGEKRAKKLLSSASGSLFPAKMPQTFMPGFPQAGFLCLPPLFCDSDLRSQ